MDGCESGMNPVTMTINKLTGDLLFSSLVRYGLKQNESYLLGIMHYGGYLEAKPSRKRQRS